MPEEIEVETKELQETIQELHEERLEREQDEKKTSWTRYVAMTTAILAVFAAIGALQSGFLVNEAMILQLKASDSWNEYQADRQKDHLYLTLAFGLVDNGAKPPANLTQKGAKKKANDAEGKTDPKSGEVVPKAGETASKGEKAASSQSTIKDDVGSLYHPMTPDQRLADYIQQQQKEADKEDDLKAKATELERDSEEQMHRHHRFAASVALLQVAIALGAIASLTKVKAIWGLSLFVGLSAFVFFFMGSTGI